MSDRLFAMAKGLAVVLATCELLQEQGTQAVHPGIEQAERTSPATGPGQGFTLIELLVVIAVITLLTALLAPAMHLAREAGRRATCLGHLRQIQIAWQTYAEENDSFIVNGTAWSLAEPPVNGKCWLVGVPTLTVKPESPAHADGFMRTGALASYVGNVAIYRCPSRYRRPLYPTISWTGSQYLSSYGIVSTMNCFPPSERADIDEGLRAALKSGERPPFVTKLSDMTSPAPASRLVFLDAGRPSWDLNGGWGADLTVMGPIMWTTSWGWAGGPHGAPIHHSNGTCLSFADGHCEYWKWKDPSTIADAQAAIEYYEAGVTGTCPARTKDPDNPDFLRLHNAIWGKKFD
jgi:prepilin-type N-terminal cleavage/methylation domain-containing protein